MTIDILQWEIDQVVLGSTLTVWACGIWNYSSAHGITIEPTFREEGVSGTKELENRPALQELLLATEAGDVRVVLIEALNRLARDLMIQETILSDFQRRGITVISVTEPELCSDDPSRKLIASDFRRNRRI